MVLHKASSWSCMKSALLCIWYFLTSLYTVVCVTNMLTVMNIVSSVGFSNSIHVMFTRSYLKTWDTVNVNDAPLLSAWPRWPLSPSEIQISLKVLVFRGEVSNTTQPPANFKKPWNERDRRGVCWWGVMKRQKEGERGRECVLRDTARTSPRSHMVVEMVLYGCLSVC